MFIARILAMLKRIINLLRHMMPGYRKRLFNAELKNLNHVAIMPDGNRRWARNRGLQPTDGHRAAIPVVGFVVDSIFSKGIHTLTLVWSTMDNRKRASHEFETILLCAKKNLELIEPKLHLYEAKFVHVVNKKLLPKDLIDLLSTLEAKTQHYDKHIFNYGVDYSGLDEVCRAVAMMIETRVSGQSLMHNQRMIFDYLDTKGQPYPSPDFILRTGGRLRLSGHFPLQSGSSEFIFADYYFPELNEKRVLRAISEFAGRVRTFGGDAKSEEHEVPRLFRGRHILKQLILLLFK